MEKEETQNVIEVLKLCVASLNEVVEKLNGTISGTEETQKEVIPDIEEIRGVLAKKAGAGKIGEVRELLQKYGAEKLSDVKSDDYSQLLKDAEGL